MDFTSAFKSEVFRPLTTIGIPGAIAVSPYVLVALHQHPAIAQFWRDHDAVFVAIVIVAALAAGLLLENVGALIESKVLDRMLQDRDGDHQEIWERYLQLRVRDEIVGQRYLRGLVTRLKFELAMLPALLCCLVGVHWLQRVQGIWSVRDFQTLNVYVSVLLLYLFYESYLSAANLGKTRRLVVRATEALVPRQGRFE